MTPELRRVAPVLLANGLVFFALTLGNAYADAVYRAIDANSWLSGFEVYNRAIAPLISLAGAAVIGTIADRRDRKTAIALVLIIVGSASAAFAVFPSDSSQGSAGVMFLVPVTSAQGPTVAIVLYLLIHATFVFAVNAQLGPATAFIFEAAPSQRRGLFVSLLGATATLGTTLAILFRLALGQENSRIALCSLVILLPAALLLRSRHARPEGNSSQGWQALPRPILFSAAAILLALAVTTELINSVALPNLRFNGFGVQTYFWITIDLVCVVMACFGGWLLDRYGPRTAMLATGLPLGIFTFLLLPLAVLLNIDAMSFIPLLLTIVVTLILQAAAYSPAPVALAQNVPPVLRARIFNLIYAAIGAVMTMVAVSPEHDVTNLEVILRVVAWIAAIVAMFRLFPRSASQ
jgi:MFS family permease